MRFQKDNYLVKEWRQDTNEYIVFDEERDGKTLIDRYALISNLPFELSEIELAVLKDELDEAMVMECTVAELDRLGEIYDIELEGLKADKQAAIITVLFE